tara:strand:- start:7708 stop:10047 length:2340 start_codon:yes stop_codon:yes gene_type:complete
MDVKCPLTKRKIKEPVIAADGHTYERKEFMKFVRRFRKSPVTGEPLTDTDIVFTEEYDEKYHNSDDILNSIRDEIKNIIELKAQKNHLEDIPSNIKMFFSVKYNNLQKNKKNENDKNGNDKNGKDKNGKDKNGKHFKNILYTCSLKIDNEVNDEYGSQNLYIMELRKFYQHQLSNFYFTIYGDDTNKVFMAKMTKSGLFIVEPEKEFHKQFQNTKQTQIKKWNSYTKEANAKWWLDDINSDDIVSSPIRALLQLKDNISLFQKDPEKENNKLLKNLENLEMVGLNEGQMEIFQPDNFKELVILEGPPGTGKTTVIKNLIKFIHTNCESFKTEDAYNYNENNHIIIILSEKNRGVEAVAERLDIDDYENTLAFGSDNIGLTTSRYLIENKVSSRSEMMLIDLKLQKLFEECLGYISKLITLLSNVYSHDILEFFNFYNLDHIDFYIQHLRTGNKKFKSQKLYAKIQSVHNEYYKLFQTKIQKQQEIVNYYFEKCKNILVTFGSLNSVSLFLKKFPPKSYSIIIDESSTLLPWQGFYLERFMNELQGKFANLILIGDSKQLPPYWVDSNNPFYEHKSFLDIAKSKTEFYSLKTQYRMPKPIMNILNKSFYTGNPLVLGNSNTDKDSIAWFHLDGCDEEVNEKEVKYILNLAKSLSHGKSCIIISPYKSQCELFNNYLEKYKEFIPSFTTVMTLDQCQGHEADYIFVSLVKQNPTSFLTPKRTCVLISRAKFQLVLFGNRQNYLSCKNYALRNLARFPGKIKTKNKIDSKIDSKIETKSDSN